MLNAVLQSEIFIIRLERHTIIAHRFVPVSTEFRIFTSRNLSILCFPKCIYCILFDSLPRFLCSYDGERRGKKVSWGKP